MNYKLKSEKRKKRRKKCHLTCYSFHSESLCALVIGKLIAQIHYVSIVEIHVQNISKYSWMLQVRPHRKLIKPNVFWIFDFYLKFLANNLLIPFNEYQQNAGKKLSQEHVQIVQHFKWVSLPHHIYDGFAFIMRITFPQWRLWSGPKVHFDVPFNIEIEIFKHSRCNRKRSIDKGKMQLRSTLTCTRKRNRDAHGKKGKTGKLRVCEQKFPFNFYQCQNIKLKSFLLHSLLALFFLFMLCNFTSFE